MTADSPTCRPLALPDASVRAILSGRKVQFRQVVSPRNSTVLGYPAKPYWPHLLFEHAVPRERSTLMEAVMELSAGRAREDAPRDVHLDVPYRNVSDPDRWPIADLPVYRVRPAWEPGDGLWVKETWSPDHRNFYPNFATVYRADGIVEVERGRVFSPESNAWYPFRWHPSIHMPRYLSRLTLRITEVHAERLADVSPGDDERDGLRRHAEAGVSWVWAATFEREPRP